MNNFKQLIEGRLNTIIQDGHYTTDQVEAILNYGRDSLRDELRALLEIED